MKNYETLASKRTELLNLSNHNGPIGFFSQEALRFISIAGTLYNLQIDLSDSSSIDERYISHILSRSLIENFFKIIYIFDEDNDKAHRYDTFVDSFKANYKKLADEEIISSTLGSCLEPADISWTKRYLNCNNLDLKSMLGKVRNQYNDKLDYLYAIYRVASFDTHGQNLKNITDQAFGKAINFPVIKLNFGLELIADEYLTLFENLQNKGEI